MWIRVWSVCVFGVMTWGNVAGEASAMQGRLVTGLESGFAIGRVAPDWDFVPAPARTLREASAERAGRESVGRPHPLPHPLLSDPGADASEECAAEQASQAEKGEKSDKSDKADRADKAEKSEKGEKAERAGKSGGKSGGSALRAGDAPVNLNSSSADQIEALPGIGPALALRIVEYREQNGPFKRIEDLMNVRGVGEKNFLKLKPLITVGGAKAER